MPPMQYVEVAGVRVSKIGLGRWQFGSREWGYGRDYAHDEAIRITNKALDLGINLIDTAEIYGFGQSERIVGRAITGRRDEAFVATKIWPLMPVAPLVVDRGRRSARRLKVDTIDLYQVHQANPFRARWNDDERDAPAAARRCDPPGRRQQLLPRSMEAS